MFEQEFLRIELHTEIVIPFHIASECCCKEFILTTRFIIESSRSQFLIVFNWIPYE